MIDPEKPTIPFPYARRLLLVGLAVVVSMPALAFGPDGHRIVAELAERALSPAARAEVRRLLADEPEPTLAAISNWADEIRGEPDWRWTGPWHYLNFPRDGGCRYVAARDCREGRCIVAALDTQARVLGDPGKSDLERAQALRFVVHFVGDIHQPLHAGYGDDRGGNTFQVFYASRGSNLHALWDGGLLRAPRRDWREYTDLLQARSIDAQVRWTRRAAQRWAEESCRLIDSAGIYPPRPGRLPSGYVERQLPVVERQLGIAGARLAALLNAQLGKR